MTKVFQQVFRANVSFKNGFAGKAQMPEVLGGVLTQLYKFICLSVILLSVISCNKPPDNRPCPNQDNCFGVWMDYILYVQYKDGNFVDLLDSHNVNSYNIDSIKIYYLAPDGCVVYYFNEISQQLGDNSVAYRGFDIISTDNGYFFVLDLFGNEYHKHGNTEIYWGKNSDVYSNRTIYVELNSIDTDTVYAEINHLCGDMLSQNPGNYCTYDVYGKIYYNSKLIVSSWEDNQEKMSQGIYPTIIK